MIERTITNSRERLAGSNDRLCRRRTGLIFAAGAFGLPFSNWACNPVLAKSPAEAISELGQASESDSGGFALMVISVLLLLFIAITLITITSMYMLKGKRSTRKGD